MGNWARLVGGLGIVGLVGLFLYGRATAPRFPAREFTVLTFNVRSSLMADKGDRNWEERRPLALDLLTWKSPDIVGFQEVSPEQRRDLSSGLDDYRHVGSGRDADGGGEQCPIYWKEKGLVKEASGTFWLSPTPSRPSRGWDAQLPRICTWVRYSDFTVFNAHLDHAGRESRRQSLRLIRGRARGSVVILGDFNDAQSAPALEPVDDLVDAYAQVHPRERPTFHNFQGAQAQEGHRIDFVFVSPDLEVVSAQVVDYESKVSDHYPVLVRFRQKASP